MLENIKHLLKHSIIYSISNVALKASGVILLPLYTAFFSVEEYGRLGLLLVTIIVISQSLVLGQSLSLIRYNNTTDDLNKRRTILFTLTLLILSVVIIFVLATNLILPQISRLFGDVELFQPLLEISIYIIAFISLNNLFLSKLRADDKSVLFAFSGIVKIIIMIALNIYLIVYRGFGIEGVLYAQLVGEAIQTIIIIPHILRQIEFKFEYKILVPTLKFGLPLIFSAMAINLLNGSDRYLLNFLANETVLGLYELGYKVAGVVNMFVIMPFGFTLMPLAYKLYKKENDKVYYKKIKTYAAFIFVWSGLALSLFSKEIIMIFAADQSYYQAFKVVPLIVLAYVFYGISMISSLGMHLTGNNKFAAYITIFCASLNIGLNFWLIPKFGMMGAALNTVIAYVFLDIFSNIASNRYYKIHFEYFKLFKLIILGIFTFSISLLISDYELLISVLFKSILILIFPLAIILLKYFDKQELDAISGGFKKWWNPLDWKKNILIELSKTKNNKTID